MSQHSVEHMNTTHHQKPAGRRRLSIVAVAALVVGLTSAIVSPASAATTYTLTYSAGANGFITGITPQLVNAGETGTAISAFADAHYHFVNWSDSATANPRVDTSVAGNITVVANFAIDTRTLTYLAGANGSITGITPQTVNYGDTGTAVTAAAVTGYHFVNWSDSSTTNPRIDTNVITDLLVTANFAIDTHTLTYLAGANGSITGTSPQTLNYGETGTAVTAVPNANYHFVNWSDSSTTNPRIDTNVIADLLVTANFAIDTRTLTYTAGANGSITGSLSQTVNYGETGTAVTAVPDANYHFVDWSDSSTANPRIDTNVITNESVTANFAFNDSHTVLYLHEATGTIVGFETQTVAWDSSTTAVTAVANPLYVFWMWSDLVRTATRTDAHIMADLTVTARFWLASNAFTLNYSTDGHGTILGYTPQIVPSGMNGDTVTAVPAVGYHFVRWSDNVLTASRIDLSVAANLSVVAFFALDVTPPPPVTYYVLTYLAGANGTITGTAVQSVPSGGNGAAVTATANTGFHFVNWSDSSTANPRMDTNTVASHTFTANFAANVVPVAQLPLTLSAGSVAVTVGGTTTATAAGGSGTGVVTYTSITPAICSVNAAGLVTALAVGTCTITASKAADVTYLVAVSPALTITVAAAVVVPPVPTVTKKSIAASAFFRAYSAVLTASGLKAIKGLAQRAKALVASGYVYTRLVVKGYVQPTQATGNDKSLSTARAKAVVSQLKKLGVRGAVVVIGLGRWSAWTSAGRRADAVITLTLTR